MFEKLASVESRYEGLLASLGTSAVQNDPAEYRKQAKALSDMEPLVEKFREYKAVAEQIAHAEELTRSSDADMRSLAEDELSALGAHRDRLMAELKVLLLPKDPNDDKNVIVEIRAGTGGEEAALFAGDLYRMYTRYAEQQGWKSEILSATPSGTHGFREVILEIK